MPPACPYLCSPPDDCSLGFGVGTEILKIGLADQHLSKCLSLRKVGVRWCYGGLLAVRGSIVSLSKLTIAILEIGLFASCAAAIGAELVNEKPMYGGIQFNEEQKIANAKFVSGIVNATGSKELAVNETIMRAWRLFYDDDFATSMRRFNQAWLVDSENSEVYFGFATLVQLQNKRHEAMSLYKRALELNPNHPMAQANLARCIKDEAYELYRKGGTPGLPSPAVRRLLPTALSLYEKSSRNAGLGAEYRLSSRELDLRYIYYQWAVALEFDGQFALAFGKRSISAARLGVANSSNQAF